jgi:hypothetical protein
VAQQEVRHSLCAAGLGSVYICADLLGLTAGGTLGGLGEWREEGLPPALKLVVPEAAAGEGRPRDSSRVSSKLVRDALTDGNRWFSKNYRIDPPEWTLYYLYTLERYQSFRELAERRVQAEPRWYNDGVQFLRAAQKPNGSWDIGGGGSVVDTAFGILFLKRSAQKSIERSVEGFEGLLIGGRGLPRDTRSVRIQAGKVVRTPFQGTVDTLLAILEDGEHADVEAISPETAVVISDDPVQREDQLRRLRRLAAAESYEVRIAAVRALGSVRDLDNIPTLIYALNDPDRRVAEAALRGLKFVSRKFSGVGMRSNSTDEQRQLAIDAWKKWYLSIRPDAQFLQ